MTANDRGRRLRLENDAAAAMAWAKSLPARAQSGIEGAQGAAPRIAVEVRRWFDAPAAPIQALDVTFPRVRTAFRLPGNVGPVVMAQVSVQVAILPNASEQPFPEGEPRASIEITERGGLAGELEPFLPGLYWCSPTPRTEALEGEAALLLRRLAGGAPGPGSGEGLGFPCLWRSWDPRWSLIFVIRQAWSLLTMGISSSPGDALSRNAAIFWATQREFRTPFEPPLPGLVEVQDEEAPPRRSLFGTAVDAGQPAGRRSLFGPAGDGTQR